MKIFGGKTKQLGRRERSAEQTAPKNTTFSYYQNRVIPEKDRLIGKDRLAKAKMSHRLQYIPTVLAVIAIFISLGYIMSVQPKARIIVVNDQNRVTRSFLRPEDTYTQAANKWLRGSPMDYTKLTLNSDKLAQDLQKQFPELAHVSVSLPIIGRRPLVYIQVTQPAYTYISQTGAGYVLDEQGRAMMNAGDSLAPLLTTVKDDAAQDVQLGNQVLPSNQIDFMQTVQKQLAAKNITVLSFELPPRANELLVKFKGLKYYAKFSFVSDPKQQSGALLAVKDNLEKNKITPKQYIDVRVDERVYYK